MGLGTEIALIKALGGSGGGSSGGGGGYEIVEEDPTVPEQTQTGVKLGFYS